MYKCLKRLANAILENRFNESKYSTRKEYYGVEICTMPMFCSYGQIGYSVSVYSDDEYKLQYDWELKVLTINNKSYKDVINLLYLADNDVMQQNDEPVWDNYSRSVELECYTDAGGDMIIDLEEPTKEKLQEYIDDFDIHAEVMLYWSSGQPANGVPFKNIKEHYNDLEDWLKWLQSICNKMPY